MARLPRRRVQAEDQLAEGAVPLLQRPLQLGDPRAGRDGEFGGVLPGPVLGGPPGQHELERDPIAGRPGRLFLLLLRGHRRRSLFSRLCALPALLGQWK